MLLAGKDAYLNAETGTGKTLAYLLPLFCRLQVNRPTQVVVVAPTHELAIQIQRQCTDLAQHSGRAMFFGREAEFNLIRKRFEHSEHGGLLVFCGERRSGKTSILFQILDHRLGPAFVPVLIDMQSMAVGSEAEFLTRVSEEILTAIGAGAEGIVPPDFGGESSRSTVFGR